MASLEICTGISRLFNEFTDSDGDTWNQISNFHKMSVRSLSAYKDTSAPREYPCTVITNGHKFCKLF